MQQLILQASEPDHFEKTIRKPLTLLDVEEWLTDKEKGELDQIYGNDRIHIWGVRPGQNHRNRTPWQKAHPGDVVCFVKSKIVIFWAAITYKTLNPILSEQLWGRDNKDQTWEYMYFMENGVFHGLPLEQVNVLLEYEEEFYPQGLTVPVKWRTERLIENYGGDILAILEDISEQGFAPSRKDRDYVRSEVVSAESSGDLKTVLEKLNRELQGSSPQKKRRLAYAIVRNKTLADLVKQAADYRCELCQRDGFEKKGGGKYAEVHHVEELGSGGKDLPENMICVCPLCHRQIHYGENSPI